MSTAIKPLRKVRRLADNPRSLVVEQHPTDESVFGWTLYAGEPGKSALLASCLECGSWDQAVREGDWCLRNGTEGER